MVATIQQIIGKINPELYAENGKELLKKYGSSENIPAEEIKPKPLSKHKLIYDSSSETLEPVYFFILDLMNDRGLAPEKLIDNFSSSPGSGHFSELGQRATIMQQQGTKILADINTVMRSVLNIIYDLKEFRIRIQNYDDLKSKDQIKKEGAILSLKQIWMDKVDVTKGQSSIKGLGMGQAGFTTLIDAFLAVKDEESVKNIDLNERVKRILLPRIQEFNIWAKESERELRKRYEIERKYLKTQVNSLKLYSRWAKPYLKAAQQLESADMEKNPSLVKAFNTILLELTLLGKDKLDVKSSAIEEDLPLDFKKLKIKRNYYSCLLMDFQFRGIPQRVSQQSHYVFGGKVEVNFVAYSLNDDELKKINKELEESDLGDALKLIEASTTGSLEDLQEEINFFLEENIEENEEKSESEGSNPFLALIGIYNKKPNKEFKSKNSSDTPLIRKDDWTEKEHLRKLTSKISIDLAEDMLDIYKKAHDMASYT